MYFCFIAVFIQKRPAEKRRFATWGAVRSFKKRLCMILCLFWQICQCFMGVFTQKRPAKKDGAQLEVLWGVWRGGFALLSLPHRLVSASVGHDSLCVGRDSFVRVTWLVYVRRRCIAILTTSFGIYTCGTWLITCGTWLIYMCDMTHLCEAALHYTAIFTSSFTTSLGICTCGTWLIMCGTWLICTCDVTHLCEAALRCYLYHIVWYLHMWDMTHRKRGTWLITYGTWLFFTCDVTHFCEAAFYA